MSLNTAAPSYASGQVVTAAQLNALQDGIQVGWDVFTPTWMAVTTNPTLGNGALAGRYRQLGKTIDWKIFLAIGSTTGVGSGAYQFGMPFSPANFSGYYAGVATLTVNAPSRLMRMGDYTAGQDYVIFYDQAGAALGSGTAAWSSSSRFLLAGRYEAA